MTLITNEIHMLDGFRKTMLVFAADRLISKHDGSYDSIRPKLFRIHNLDGGISYFGLAAVYPSGSLRYLSDWLPTFINRNSGLQTLQDFSFRLRDELNQIVPSSVLLANPSGLHICGYNALGLPEFWYITNIGGTDEGRYTNLQPKYNEPSSDFLLRDAIHLGWDGVNPNSVANAVQFYRNGDFRGHAVAWERLDQMLGELVNFQDFKGLENPADFASWVKFKMEFIVRFYRKFARDQIVGGPIDVFCLSKQLP
jgi:hypothetical protein